MRNSHVHVVYGFTEAPALAPGTDWNAPKVEPAVMGFGRSDRRALADARSKATGPLVFFYVRSSGALVPAF